MKELDDETTVIALAGQEQTLLRQHDGDCAFCRWASLDFVFALLVRPKVILLLPSASLPQLEACVPAKNLSVALDGAGVSITFWGGILSRETCLRSRELFRHV